MDEHVWLAICFVAFMILTYKPISKAFLGFLVEAQNAIKSEVKKAEDIFLAAKEKLDESKAMHTELPNTKKYLFNQENVEIEHDLEVRNKALDDQIKIKKEQLQNLMNHEYNELRKELSVEIISSLKKKFIVLINKDKKLSDSFEKISIF